ncbi:MAG TPA: amidohydrolase [Candidatus Limnocylindria bacterium]|nr:amidohydrolase [Candidatus Limnocylindria bacterium]
MTPTDPKQVARERIERAHEALIGLSHRIHANPELGYQEKLASGWLAEWLEGEGFEVEGGAAGLETAFVGGFGPGPLNIALIAEYDALPEIGHACGHNIISATAVGAALALAGVADGLGLRVTVIGTPAEEGGAGKVELLNAGIFDAVHCALMIHPGPGDVIEPEVLAAQSLEITYSGRTSHAGAAPERGINAADGLVIAQVAIGLLRQSLLPTDRVHGIVTVGGEAMNVIPARAEAIWMIRASTVARLDELREKVRRCFEAGALASGASLEISERTIYADMRHDPDLVRLYAANAQALGRTFGGPGEFNRFSTDQGNVSYAVPAIHPILGIDSGGAVNHQPEFAAATVTPAADSAIFDGAVALAWTAIDAATDEALRSRLLERRPV